MTIVLLGTFAGIGAVIRYLSTRLAEKARNWSLPWATYGVNMVASFAIGFFFAGHLSDATYKIAAVGFCGGLSTFSTFNFELFAMLDEHKYMRFAKYFLLTYGLGFLMCLLGMVVGKKLRL